MFKIWFYTYAQSIFIRFYLNWPELVKSIDNKNYEEFNVHKSNKELTEKQTYLINNVIIIITA